MVGLAEGEGAREAVHRADVGLLVAHLASKSSSVDMNGL